MPIPAQTPMPIESDHMTSWQVYFKLSRKKDHLIIEHSKDVCDEKYFPQFQKEISHYPKDFFSKIDARVFFKSNYLNIIFSNFKNKKLMNIVINGGFKELLDKLVEELDLMIKSPGAKFTLGQMILQFKEQKAFLPYINVGTMLFMFDLIGKWKIINLSKPLITEDNKKTIKI